MHLLSPSREVVGLGVPTQPNPTWDAVGTTTGFMYFVLCSAIFLQYQHDNKLNI